MFENPRRGRQARNFTTNVSKIVDLKSSSEQIIFRKLSLGAPDKRQLFCQSVALTLWFRCLYERSTIILVEMFSDMCCLEDNASRNCPTNTVARSTIIMEEDMLKRWVIFTFYVLCCASHGNLYSSRRNTIGLCFV